MNIDVFPDGRLVLNDRTYRCSLGSGRISRNKKEADGATPAGCFPLRNVLYRADRINKPDTKLDCRPIESDDGWCDDPACPDYNRLVKLPHAGSFEKLWRKDHIYDAIVPLGYNDNPVQLGRGSAVFLHIARENYSPTRGCIALNDADLLEVLQKADSNTQIRINNKNT